MLLSKYWNLKKVVLAINGKFTQGAGDAAVSTIATNSKTIKAGELFWAIEGGKFNGNDFVADALKKGAQGAVVSRDFNLRAFSPEAALIRVESGLAALGRFAQAHRLNFSKLQVVAVTGSNGKTTTKEMIGKVLSAQAPSFINPGNFNNEVGCPLSVLELKETYQYAVFELAARHKGDIGYLASIARPSVAVLTNVSSAHLETFGNVETIFETKSEILNGLSSGDSVIYYAEDSRLARLPSVRPGFRYTSFGLSPSADVQGKIRAVMPQGLAMDIFYKAQAQGMVKLRMNGKIAALNALAAFACGLNLLIPVEKIIEALENFYPMAQRGETFELVNKLFQAKHIVVNDAYNANPVSMKEGVLGFLEAYKEYPKIVVLGQMRELGKEEFVLHEETARKIVTEGNTLLNSKTAFVLVGGESARRMAGVLPGAVCLSKEKVRDYLLEKLTKARDSCALYFKASRAEALETIIEELKS